MLDCPPGFEGYRRGCKDTGRNHDSSGGRQASALTSNGESFGTEGIIQSVGGLSPSFGFAPQGVANGVHRTRRRYHGLIDGEEEGEMIQLGPPLLPEYLSKLFSMTGSKGLGAGASGAGAREGGM
ncbi:hypothetical protein BT93_E1041 [Corymbia citriodora subsp. variegata]|nr:hypothetical protein BT93_E1041 [Corymbia citriodora subsp. variegata]